MLKYSLILLGAYLLYYAGNIVYDLFMKKEKDVQTDATEEFSLSDFAEKTKDEVQEIGIEDVENLNTPKSFSKRELIPTSHADYDEIQDVEYWRQKFESEQNMDDFDNKEESTENTPENAEASLSKNEEKKGYINNEVSKEFDSDSTLLIEDQETRILSSIYLKKYLNRSRTLAEMVEEEFRKKGIKSGGGAMQFTRGIRVLGATAMPSVLVETGFICNPQDEQYLNSSDGQNTLAEGILHAVLRYKNSVDAGNISENTLNQ